ncbi:MAG: alpha/beta hydrolase family protein [Alphaproteobacteria bacterium]
MAPLVAALLLAPGAAGADETYQAGYLRLTAPGDPPVPVSLWYPTTAAESAIQAGPYTITAALDAPPVPGKHRLVVISHGSGGSDLGHRDLAEFLARHGIVVAAPRHLGDSYDRPEGRGSDVQLIGRPWQIVATLDAVLGDARIAQAVDPTRIGMAGFSAGGYTTLVIAGAKPDLELGAAHCAEHPEDREICAARPDKGPRTTRPGWQLPHETRVKAAVVMAPLGVFFDKAGLAGIDIPLRLYEAADDHVLVNAWNTRRVLAALPRPVEHASVAGGHFVFLAPCPAALAAEVPVLCSDPPGVDRAAIHRQINAEILDFFDRTLGRE